MTVTVNISVPEGQPGGLRVHNMDDGVSSSHTDILPGETVQLYVHSEKEGSDLGHELFLEMIALKDIKQKQVISSDDVSSVG